MSFAPAYLIYRFFYRIVDFFHHWYVRGSLRFAHAYISFLENLDRTFALRLTIRYFFQPLWKDYSMVGRILGVVFRSGRIIIGTAIYSFFSMIFLALYFAWLLIPPGILFYAFIVKN